MVTDNMKTSVFFSIIVPAYQVEEYIDDCIESILKQNYKKYEVIIVDDGSTDLTVQKSDSYEKKYNNVKVLHKKNGGLSSARNAGIRTAKGEYVIFLDSDDFLAENALDNLNRCISNYNSPKVVINRWSYYRNGRIYEVKDGELYDEKHYMTLTIPEIYSNIQKISLGCLGACFFCVQLEYIKNYNLFFYEGIFHEDEEWIPRMFLNTNNIGFNNNSFYNYRISREGAITASLNIKREFDKMLIIDLLESEFSPTRYSASAIDAISYHRQAILFGILTKVCVYRSDELYVQLLNEIKEHIYLLKKSSRITYRMCFGIASLVGVRITSKLLFLYMKIRRVTKMSNQ